MGFIAGKLTRVLARSRKKYLSGRTVRDWSRLYAGYLRPMTRTF